MEANQVEEVVDTMTIIDDEESIRTTAQESSVEHVRARP